MGLMTPKQFAAVVNIDERTVRRLANKGELPGAYKLGSIWRIDYEKWEKEARNNDKK